MNRKIEFRGKNHQGRWCFGSLIVDGEFTTIKRKISVLGPDNYAGVPIKNDYYWESYHVDPETVGQFTGLKDSNRCDIFEGDILKCRIKKFEHIPYVVGYRLGLFETRPNNQNLASSPLKFLLNDDDEGTALKSWTIIGNIHDNPELLKGGEK